MLQANDIIARPGSSIEAAYNNHPYVIACREGEEKAMVALAEMASRDFSPLLGWIIKDMVVKGVYTGVEVGFCSYIAEMAIKGWLRHAD